MKIPFYHINAFTTELEFSGNPAGVCFLEEWLDDKVLQSIGTQNNLSETAFVVRKNNTFELRWFSPTMEIDLCGHATLASAFALFQFVDPSLTSVTFKTKSGDLSVQKEGDGRLAMDFPSRKPVKSEMPDDVLEVMGATPSELWMARDLMMVFETEEEVKNLKPDFQLLEKLPGFGVIATAKGNRSDFVSRFFVPKAGIDEDPVTGSAHCTLIPFWAEKLGKNELHAYQLSARGGELFCRNGTDRVVISGRAQLFLSGAITL